MIPNAIRLTWHTGTNTIESCAIDVPNEHYADLFEKALRAAGTSRVVWFRLTEEEAS